jgi:hypothetical protein
MLKTGTELELKMTPIQRKNLTWTSHTTFANVNNRLLTLAVPCSNGGSFFSARYGAPWVCAGQSLTTVQVFNGFDTTFVNGQFKSRARHPLYLESAPDFQMGFQNDFTVGPVRVGGMLDWRKGGYTVNLTNAYWDGTGLLADTAAMNKRNADFAKGYGVYLEKATFLKLREINVSYSIPASLAHRVFGNNARDLRLEFAGRNLYSWTPYTGYDPEVSNFGNQNIGRFQDVTPYPSSRSFFFSISANF